MRIQNRAFPLNSAGFVSWKGREAMYQVGEMIIYGGEGVCRVEAVGRLNMPGVSKEKVYYTLSPLYRDGKIYTPVDTTVFMRPVISREDAEELIRSIPDIQAAACTDRNLRVLTEHYQALIRSHNCSDMVQVIKAAYEKRQEKRSQGSKPGQVDERYMKRAEELLHGELAVALGISRDEVGGYIADVVQSIQS